MLEMEELEVVCAESLVRNFREIRNQSRSTFEEEGIEPCQLLQAAFEACLQGNTTTSTSSTTG